MNPNPLIPMALVVALLIILAVRLSVLEVRKQTMQSIAPERANHGGLLLGLAVVIGATIAVALWEV